MSIKILVRAAARSLNIISSLRFPRSTSTPIKGQSATWGKTKKKLIIASGVALPVCS
ncbi:MAG: hypothetical protein PVF83_07290 [Anaerolineales bacterium]